MHSPMTPRKRDAAAAHIRKALTILGIDTTSPDCVKTPDRVVKSLEEQTSSLRGVKPYAFTTFKSPSDMLVVGSGILYSSLCSHHLLPFYGTVHLGYLPDQRAAGWSKFTHLVRYCARRPQMQEEFTERIASEIMSALQPKALMVIATGVHTCSRCRGVCEPHSQMTTSALRGDEKVMFNIRQEVMELLRVPTVH